MKALIRNGEVYTEDQWSSFTRAHLAYMTGTERDANGKLLPGDGWTLVENYVAPTETAWESCDIVEPPSEPPSEPPAEDPAEEIPETIVIDGVTYTRTS